MEAEGQFDDAPVEYIGWKFAEKTIEDEDEVDDVCSDYSDEGYDEDYPQFRAAAGANPNLQSAAVTSAKNFQPTEKLFKKFANKINVDKYEGPALNLLQEQSRKNDKVTT